MAHQIEERTRNEVLLAEEATGRDMAGVVDDLNDQLTTIRAYANLGEEVSYDAELTESYFALIESSGKKAVLLTRELLALEPTRPSSEGGRTSAMARPALQQTATLTNEPPQTASSFRRRLGLTS